MTDLKIRKATINDAKTIAQAELLVRATNTQAISLYKKMGFVEEGRLTNRVRVSETEFIDDITMGLWVK